jgi:hypothetical protein
MTRWLILAVLAVAATAAHGQAIVVATCGSGAYPVGQLHQLTMNPAGYLCVSTTSVLRGAEAPGAMPAASDAKTPPEAPKPPTPLVEPKK